MERTITATEFRERAGQYIDESGKTPIIITKHQRPARVLLDVDEYRRLKQLDDHQNRQSEDAGRKNRAEVA